MADLVQEDDKREVINEPLEENVYPTETTFYMPNEPAEQVKEKKQEEGSVQESKKVIEEIIEHYNERIEFYKSVDSIPIKLDDDPELLIKVLSVNKMILDVLLSEKEWLIDKMR